MGRKSILKLIFLLKPIIDMFYNNAIFDYFLMFLVIILVFLTIQKIGRPDFLDWIVCILVFFFTLAMVRNQKGIYIYIKIIFGFLLYFMGRSCGETWREDSKILVLSSYLVVLTNFSLLLTGNGFQYLGRAFTFQGMYYFKGDLAAAMVQSMIIIFILGKNTWICKTLVFGAIPCMILLSNSRMYLILSICIWYLFFLYKREEYTKKLFKITWKQVFLLIGMIGGAIYLFTLLLNTELFQKMGFIGFEVEHISDLYNGPNTQGRSKIWEDIMGYFNLQSGFRRWFGIDLVFDSLYGYHGKNAHNLYIRVLISIGYVGLTLFLLFIGMVMKKMNALKDRKMFYLGISFMLIYLLSGFSGNVIEYTQITWIPMYLCGAAVTSKNKEWESGHKFVSET